MKSILPSFGLEIVLLFAIAGIIWLGFKVKRKLLKHLLFNLSAIFMVLFLYEFILTIITKPLSEITYSDQHYVRNPDLGYSARDSLFSVSAKKHWIKSGEEIYDVTYSFANGRRVTPNSDSLSRKYAMFLGGSFVFGEGVNDNQTLPYHYNAGSSEPLNIRNYGFHGYGMHQVYTIVKDQIVNDSTLMQAERADVFYWFLNLHIARTNGYSAWDRNGPKYVLENGKLSHIGTFRSVKTAESYTTKLFNTIWKNSVIFNNILGPRISTGEDEVNLFLALVKETDLLLKARGFNLTVLVYDMAEGDLFFPKHHQSVLEKVKRFFGEQDIKFIDVNEGMRSGEIRIGSHMIEGDGHPVSRFHKDLADYIWKLSRTSEARPENQ